MRATKRTRRSQNRFYYFPKHGTDRLVLEEQATIETSVFGAEFVAMKHGMECLRGLRYKLRMMGVSISGPSYIYGDNMSVIHNTQRPESILKKKSNADLLPCYSQAGSMGKCLTGSHLLRRSALLNDTFFFAWYPFILLR
jgi:hypothetical protein